MSLKSDLYLNNLKLHLGIRDLSQIKEEHSEKIFEYMKLHEDKDVIKELFKTLPNFLSFAQESLKKMSGIVREMISAGETEVETLKVIITQLNDLLKHDHLGDREKDRIFDLMDRYSTMLDEQLKRNNTLRGEVFYGLLGYATFTLILGGFIIYKSLGGTKGGDFIVEAGRKLT